MKKKERLAKKRSGIKSVLRLPDLEHAKAAVLNCVTSSDSQRGHRHAIDEFVEWYCSTVIVSGRFLMTGISSRNMSLLQDGSSNRAYRMAARQIAAAVERMLQTEVLEIEREQEVFAAMVAIRQGRGSFADALIAELGLQAGCSHTLTFDTKGRSSSGI